MYCRILLIIVLFACAGCSASTTENLPPATLEILPLEPVGSSDPSSLLSGSFPPFSINLAPSGLSCISMELTDFWTPGDYPPQTSDLPGVVIMIDGNQVTLTSATYSSSVPAKNTYGGTVETKYPGTYALCFKSKIESGSHALSITIKTKLGVIDTFGRQFTVK